MIIEKIKKNKLIFIVASIYIISLLFFRDFGMKALNNSIYFLIEMFQVIPVIFVLTVVIDAWAPKELIIKRLGKKSGFSGMMLSVLFGSISAGPIYAAFPVTKMLLDKGASISNIVIILSSWAVIKVPMLINEVKFLGFNFMVARWIFTVIAILVMGSITAKIVKKEDIPSDEISSDGDLFEILESYCIGCGVCANMLPEYYEMNNKKAEIKKIPSKIDDITKMNEVVTKCPVNAIKYNNRKTENNKKII